MPFGFAKSIAKMQNEKKIHTHTHPIEIINGQEQRIRVKTNNGCMLCIKSLCVIDRASKRERKKGRKRKREGSFE